MILKEKETAALIPSFKLTEIVVEPGVSEIVGFILKIPPENVAKPGKVLVDVVTVSASASVVAGSA